MVWQELKAAGHIASAVKKQREVNVGPWLTFSFFETWFLCVSPGVLELTL